MTKSKYIFAVLVLTGNFFGLSTSAFAQSGFTQDTGSTSTDYQPPTRNPQENVSAGLQQYPVGLQPIPGSTSLSQESMPAVENLQVLGSTGTANPNTTKTYVTQPPKPARSVWPIVFILVALATASYYFFVSKFNTNPVALEVAEPVKKQTKSKTSKSKNKKNKSKTSTKRR